MSGWEKLIWDQLRISLVSDRVTTGVTSVNLARFDFIQIKCTNRVQSNIMGCCWTGGVSKPVKPAHHLPF